MRSSHVRMVLLLFTVLFAFSAPGSSQSVGDPEAIEALKAGKLQVANASWWGFDPEDATEILQAAIDSGAPTLVVPNMGQDWIVRPLRLRSNQKIILEDGVVISAKKGEFRGTNDSLFVARDVENLIIQGYGATIRMHKEDYAAPPYTKGEWRMGISLRGCRNVQILGLTIENTGGDGIYLGRGTRPVNERIVIRDVIADNNYRQGISVISARGLLIEDCVFRNTSGTAPMAGIDFEPNRDDEVLEDIEIRNCVFAGNEGSGITFYMKNMSPDSRVSVLIEDTSVLNNNVGISVSAGDPGAHPSGEIIIRRCVIDGARRNGLRILSKDGDRLHVLVEDCLIKNVSTDLEFTKSNVATSAPIYMYASENMGGVTFRNVVVADDKDRPILYGATRLSPDEGNPFAIKGELYVISPYRAEPQWSFAATDISFDIVQEDAAQVDYGALGLRDYPFELTKVRIQPAIRFERLSWAESSAVQGTLYPGVRLLHLDDQRVRRVDMFLNDENIYSGSTLPDPDTFKIETLALPDDQHELKVVITTDQGVLEQSARFVTQNFRYLVDSFEGPKEIAWFGTVYNPLTIDQSSGWRYLTERPQDFFGDAHRKTRQANTTEYLVWETPRLMEFRLEIYARQEQLDPEVLLLEGSSGDNVWYPLDYTLSRTDTSSAGWHKFLLQGKLPYDNAIELFRLTLRQTVEYHEIQLGQALYRLAK
ncbi:MAG: right-handed parallel beta-helix repeat-containing protein [Firmicutes bacterium]|nr:right-handed parallel beta-helix repeat-containing protein [Bacillota bacterium]